MEDVKQNGLALEYASNRLKDNHGIVMEAVKQDGNFLEYASDGLKDDHDIVMEAVKQKAYALKYASDRLRNEYWFIAKLIQEGIFSSFGRTFKEFCSVLLKPKFLSDLRTALSLIKRASGIGKMNISFLEQEGRPAAQRCIDLCRSYFVKRIWLLGKVCDKNLPKDVVKTIDAMSDGDLSEGFQGMSTLLECASVISALEHQNLSWTSLLNLDCIRTPHDLEAKV